MAENNRDYRETKRHAFDAYCKAILRNEARDAYDERKRRLKRETLFCELTQREFDSLKTQDEYFDFEEDIETNGLHFIVCDRAVYKALMSLAAKRREIVLLSYFGEMNDREIGALIGTGRANVQYHRSKALVALRDILEQEEDEL